MNTLDQYLGEAAISHGHLCAGQVLGVRLAMAATANGWSRLWRSIVAPPTQ